MTDRIPAEHAELFWNREAGDVPHEFEVMDIRRRGEETRRERRDPAERYFSSLGAHCANWMTGEGPGDTPEGIFAMEWLWNSPNRDAFRGALEEIAKIEEAEWARRMLSALRYMDQYS